MRVVQAAGGAPLNVPSDDGAPGEDSPAAGSAGVRSKRIGTLAVLAVVVYVLDLVTKTLVVEYLEGRDPVSVIGEVLRIRVIRNSGAAFSIGTGMTIVFTLIALVVVFAIIRTARRLRSVPWAITLGLLLGGALGNLTDRLFRYPAPLQGHVVDFIEVFPVTRFPIFNVADSAIVCGGVLAVILAWRGHQLDGTRDTGAGDQAPATDTPATDIPDAEGDGGGRRG
ncbi:signal peptidase II [Sphaerisporangium sp. TRM90804]|uniref:signal peptidase II n=1 Tax=Sphaerisporangium sp. TRM90804 TaxID=3031113 RepID=UPI002449A14D|nr:signal peptidase II [Sphaerisporangium sp. TRM90804]MDH2428598.1 signal peptidase II [Sphaerisporangium sp. TRM90804]